MIRRKITILCMLAVFMMLMVWSTIKGQREEIDKNNMNTSEKIDAAEFESNLSDIYRTPKNDQINSDATINIGDISVSLYEREQEILRKLDKMRVRYGKVEDSNITKYDYYYNVGDDTDDFMQVYFLDEECVRIRISCNEFFARTSKGLHPRNTYSQMVEQYGNSYERHTYMGKEIYTIYRYMLGEYFHEFGIVGETIDEIYNVDVYVSSQFPIYDYGEELIVDEKVS